MKIFKKESKYKFSLIRIMLKQINGVVIYRVKIWKSSNCWWVKFIKEFIKEFLEFECY